MVKRYKCLLGGKWPHIDLKSPPFLETGGPPRHWARQCPTMARSLNLSGAEKLESIFIPVVSVSEEKAGSCYGNKAENKHVE